MKSVQSKKANLILNAGDFLSPVIESKLKRAAYSHKVTLIVIATDSGMVKEILKLEPYGIEENKIEMLFIAPEQRGKGLGRQLVEYSFAKFNVTEVCVNEQNPQAHGFYERMGFEVYKRTPLDEQGQPYPLLYLRRAQD